MAFVQSESKLQRWGIDALILALGGATLSFLALLITSMAFGRSSRIAADGIPTPLMIIAVVLGVVAFFLLSRRYSRTGSCLLVVGWWLAHFFINIVAIVVFKAAMPLPFYLIAWLGVGAVYALLLRASPKGKLAGAMAVGGAATAAGAYYVNQRQDRSVLKSSGYGRIPPATVILLTQHVRTANDATNQLPNTAPASIRKIAVGAVLDHVIRDWWENENREGLTPTDVEDVRQFVNLAWAVSANQPHLKQAEATFKAVLTALMDDWFASWNADGVDGAPRWQYQST